MYLNDGEKMLARQGRYIDAIKALRTRTYGGLKECKDAVDAYRNNLGIGTGTCQFQHSLIKVNSSDMDAVVCKSCGALYKRA